MLLLQRKVCAGQETVPNTGLPLRATQRNASLDGGGRASGTGHAWQPFSAYLSERHQPKSASRAILLAPKTFATLQSHRYLPATTPNSTWCIAPTVSYQLWTCTKCLSQEDKQSLSRQRRLLLTFIQTHPHVRILSLIDIVCHLSSIVIIII